MMFFLSGASLRDADASYVVFLPNDASLRDSGGLFLLFLSSYAFFVMWAVTFMFVTEHCILGNLSFSRRENRSVEKCGCVSITSRRDVPLVHSIG